MVSRKHLPEVLRRSGGIAIAVLTLLVVALGIGVLSAASAEIALYVACAILLVGVAAFDSSLLPVAALPATMVVARVGGILTVSDLILAAAALVALFMLRGHGGMSVQPLVWSGVVYLAFLIPTLILNPYAANYIEWFHELFLVIGSMIVGFVIAREGKARIALGLYLLVCAGVGVASAFTAVVAFAQVGSFQPVYLGDLGKNTIGGMLAIGVVIAVARPTWVDWSRRFAWSMAALCAIGVFASQSRQGMIGAVVGLIIVSLRPRLRDARRGRLAWLISIPVVTFVIIQVNTQLSSGNPFNSANQRLTWFAESVTIWQTAPVFGVGLRWWYTDRFGVNFQPPNAEFEMLTSGGIVGVIGFLLMFAVAAWHLSRLAPAFGTIALAVLATRFTQAQFDLYWVAGQASVLWIIAGISYGAREHDRAAVDGPVLPPRLVAGQMMGSRLSTPRTVGPQLAGRLAR
jgi:hypothetical protein